MTMVYDYLDAVKRDIECDFRNIVFRIHVPRMIAEIERLRAELTTTLIACERCGRGVRPKYAVFGMCHECAEKEIKSLRILCRESAQDIEVWANPIIERAGYHPMTLTTRALRKAANGERWDEDNG